MLQLSRHWKTVICRVRLVIQHQAKQTDPCPGHSACHSNASKHLRARHPGSSTLGMHVSVSSISGRGCCFTACVVLVQVEMWLVANEDVKGVCGSVDIHKGERILMEMSRKFTLQDIRQLAFQSNFYVQVAAPPASGPHPLGPPRAIKLLSCSHRVCQMK